MGSSFDPIQLVESLADEFSAESRSRQIQISGFCLPELPERVGGDGDVIRDVLRALTRSALNQAALTPTPAVLIEALLDKTLTRTQIRLGVSDSRSDIRVDAARKEVESLAKASKRELDKLQTQLEVDENLIGRSTRYFFTLPMERVHVERNEPVLSPEVRDLRIFLVANDPTPNRIIQHYSRHAGITLEGAPTGAEAILELARASQEAPYDILAVAPPIEDLTSLQMAKAVRGSDLAYLKLLYVAPWDDPQDRLNHIQGGFDDTICKPLRKKEMFDSFHRLAGRIPKKQQGKTPLILIVEDNGINAQIASFQLRTLGYDSEIVTNGELAVEAWTRGTFDAILMDLQMPVLDGFAATRMIREREQNRSPSGRIPIIAFTANDDWKAQAMAAGCDDFLIKPVVKNVLKATMDRWLKASVR